jgi:hypothetical protein
LIASRVNICRGYAKAVITVVRKTLDRFLNLAIAGNPITNRGNLVITQIYLKDTSGITTISYALCSLNLTFDTIENEAHIVVCFCCRTRLLLYGEEGDE